MKRVRNKTFALLMVVMLLLATVMQGMLVYADGHPGQAVWTTLADGTEQDGNIYPSKPAVYLNFGADMPVGSYSIVVSAPGGDTLGSGTVSVNPADGQNGRINLFAVTNFADTTNNGGEYKVEATITVLDKNGREDTISKSDNFKVLLGSLTLNKVIDNPEGLTPPAFSIQVVGPDYDQTFQVTPGTPVVIDGLAWGEYTITEPSASMPANYSLVSIVEGTVTFDKGDLSKSVTVTNHYTAPNPELGSLTLNKVIDNPDGLTPPAFSIQVVGPDYDKTFQVTPGTPVVINNLALGSYTISEPAASIPVDYSLVGISDATVVFDADNLLKSVTVTNHYTNPQLGSLTLNKVIDNPEGLTPPAFSIHVVGPEYDQTFPVTPGTPVVIDNLPLGEYTISEPSVPANYSLVSIVDNVGILIDGKVVLGGEITSKSITVTNHFAPPVIPPGESGGGGGSTVGGGGAEGNDRTATTINPEPTPLAVPEPVVQPAPAEPEVVTVPEEPAPKAALPKTGEMSPNIFYGIGSILTAIGALIRRR